MPDMPVAIAIIGHWVSLVPNSCSACQPPLNAMMGMDNRKENFAEDDGESPISSAAVIVMPEREVPGINAVA